MTDEQIRAEAISEGFQSQFGQQGFIAGYNKVLSQDSKIEKVKELREKLINTETYSINRREVIEQLNAIIEAK